MAAALENRGDVAEILIDNGASTELTMTVCIAIICCTPLTLLDSVD